MIFLLDKVTHASLIIIPQVQVSSSRRLNFLEVSQDNYEQKSALQASGRGGARQLRQH